MIGQLTGKILRCSPEQVVLDVSGVGYNVHIPLSTFYTLSSGTGSTVSLHVHTHVREDAFHLYGFANQEERAVFERLIGISGVGPRLALAILSGIGVDELRTAVQNQDRGRLQKIPGVGKKTAERLLLELRDRLAERADEKRGRAPSGTADLSMERTGLRVDAISALVNLGYSRDAASRAVDAAIEDRGPDAPIEKILRGALGGLVR